MHRIFLLKVFLTIMSLILTITAPCQVKLPWDCGDNALKELQQKLIPNYYKKEQQENQRIQAYINQALQQNNNISSGVRTNGNGLPDDSTYTIPVVVHIIYPSGEAYGAGVNISYAQIRSQIEALNAAYGKNYPAYNGQTHPAYAQNTRIRFCLARTTSPSSKQWFVGPGGTEYGVERYPIQTDVYNQDITVASATKLLEITHPSQDYFPFDKYLNVWLVKTIGGGNNVMGYAPKPLIGNYPLDGIVIRADVFGDNTTGGNFALGFNLGQGKVLSHEIGHYFNLYHIFQGGCAGANAKGSAVDACDLNGDMICDIKPCTTQNILCTSGNVTTCTANYDPGTTNYDMINDYMSYADDDCMNTFTQDQTNRMWATLQLQRQTLWQAANLAATGVLGNDGCVPSYLNSTIHTDNSVYCAGTQIHFSNPTTGNTATSRQWQFVGGLPATSNTDTVTATYNNPGNYKAVLTVSDGINSRTDSIIFTVLTCQLDSSLQYMAHWYFGDYCSLDFSSGKPVKTTTALTNNTIHGELAYPTQLQPFIAATVSVSDSSGHLLFYSNGINVWNSSHKKITTSSMFGISDINASTGLCYVPYPGQPNKYFVVGVYPNFDGTPSNVKYVLVDVAANTVSAYQELQHPLLPKRYSEHLTVVPHCNGTDYWIITKGYGLDGDNNFYCFQVTAAGINVNQPPVVSSGFSHPAYGGAGNELKANRNGDKLILASPHGYINIEQVVLYDFDSRTGIVKNEKAVPNADGYSNIQGGASFSPNGEYFYLMRSTNFATNGQPYWLFQYRVSDFKYNVLPTTGFYFGDPFQLGPDNQLYIVNAGIYLARLSNPDVWGGATFDDQFLNFGRPPYVPQPIGNSLPAFIDAKRKEPTHPDFTIQGISCQTYLFSSLCFDNYTATWDFGDGSQKQTGNTINHNYINSGEFNVTLTLSSVTKTYGSITKKITVLPLTINISGPDSVCNTNNFATQYFAQTSSNVNYLWSVNNGSISGANNLSYVGVIWPKGNTDSGKIQLRISTGDNCYINTSKTVAIIKGTIFNWALKDSICITDSFILLTAFPVGGNFTGAGVNNGIFLPTTAGLGNHEITYTYGDGTICNSEVQKTIKVTNSCKIIVPIDTSYPKGPAMPTAFTPNGDGLNDLFRIPIGIIVKLYQLVIYNRWGEKIFTSTDLYKGWNGYINSMPADNGTYIYFILGTKVNGSVVKLKGTVVLIR